MKKAPFFYLLLIILLLSISSVINSPNYFAIDEDLKPPNIENPIENYPIEMIS